MNQKLSENKKAKAPIEALKIIFKLLEKLFLLNIFSRNNVVDQKRNIMTKALDTTERKLTAMAMDSLSDANNAKIAPII